MIDQTTSAEIYRAMARGRADLLEALVRLFSCLPQVMDATLLAVSADEGSVSRIGTSNETVFPRGGGEKLNSDDPWCRRIMAEKQPVLANGDAGLAHYLTEWEAIRAAGYGASGSFPVVIGGRVAGTVNMLALRGHFTPERVAMIESLLPFAALIFLFPQPDPA